MAEYVAKKLKQLLEDAAGEAMRLQTSRWAKENPADHGRVLASIGAAMLALPPEPLDSRFPPGEPIYMNVGKPKKED